MQERSKKQEVDEVVITPLCEKCGTAMLKEDEEWVCPNCQGEIDFLGDEDE
jgi:rubrerythrin